MKRVLLTLLLGLLSLGVWGQACKCQDKGGTEACKPVYNGKTLGVLGGLGPAASADFMRLLVVKAPATVDQEHPRVILLSQPQTPNRNDFIFGVGDDPEPALWSGLQLLSSWGADILCVTCNTAHYYIDHFRSRLDKPLVHIIDETVGAARERSPEGAWLTATLGTIKAGIFQDNAARSGYAFVVPDEETRNEVQEVINIVKAGRYEEAGALMRAVCLKLWSVRDIPVVAACTEIPIAYGYTGLPAEKCISSLEALADACIRELYD